MGLIDIAIRHYQPCQRRQRIERLTATLERVKAENYLHPLRWRTKAERIAEIESILAGLRAGKRHTNSPSCRRSMLSYDREGLTYG